MSIGRRGARVLSLALSRTCRLWLLEKDEFWSTIFSSSSMSSACRLACMKAFTATDTCSGFLLSGSAVDTTCPTRARVMIRILVLCNYPLVQ